MLFLTQYIIDLYDIIPCHLIKDEVPRLDSFTFLH
jgi:hypothetical protein